MILRSRYYFVGLIALSCILFSACDNTPKNTENNDLSNNFEVIWTWKRTVSGSDNVIYGTIKNKTDQPYQQVELEFRTQDSAGKDVHVHAFLVENLGANVQKPFTQSYPAQASKEDSGFVNVKKAIPAN